MEFSHFYKEAFTLDNIEKIGSYDIFISAFDNCKRTLDVFNRTTANKKIWLRFPHYNIPEEEIPADIYFNKSFVEDDYYLKLFKSDLLDDTKSICIDITGFIRPHLIYLIKYLTYIRVPKVDLLYTEPLRYKLAEETTFSGFIDHIDMIPGCSSIRSDSNTDNDLLIIAAGYDDDLLAKIARDKSHCKNRYYILGFPSLQPDMYQESILKIENARASIGENIKFKFAPAYDPFVTADIINEIISENPNFNNIYLSPLSTKPQTIGMALFYFWHFEDLPISIIFPYSNVYTTKHAIGIKKVWRYCFELPIY